MQIIFLKIICNACNHSSVKPFSSGNIPKEEVHSFVCSSCSSRDFQIKSLSKLDEIGKIFIGCSNSMVEEGKFILDFLIPSIDNESDWSWKNDTEKSDFINEDHWEHSQFEASYIFNVDLLISIQDGIPHGSVEGFNDEGYLILAGQYYEGEPCGSWIAYHPDGYNDIHSIIWSSSDRNPYYVMDWINELEYLEHDYCYTPNDLNFLFDGDENLIEISHRIFGYWSNYADPVHTFDISFQFQNEKLISRKILQQPLWGQEEVLISTELFNSDGSLADFTVHDLIKKNDGYSPPFLFQAWDNFSSENELEILMIRTNKLLAVGGIESFNRLSDGNQYSFGFATKELPGIRNIEDLYYFARGKRHGLSMHFSVGNKIKELRNNCNEIIWDIDKGFSKNLHKIKTKNLKYINYGS